MSLLCILGSFLKISVQNENIFAWQKFQVFFGVLDNTYGTISAVIGFI